MQVGTILKHYRIVSRIGEGGMGVVYRAEDVRLGRIVALKVFPEDLALDEERVERFEREARAASAISHPGIATLYDFDRDGRTTFLTMEYVEGKTLRQLLQQGCLLLPQLFDCLAQVAEALAAAHRKGIIHRDLKPENIMASDSGYYKILDFGLARMELDAERDSGSDVSPTQIATVSRELTSEGKILGTIAYMSPEQVQGHPLDVRSDIFSFGTVLYELAAGRSPFKANNAIATFHAIVHDEPEPLVTARPDVPPELERIAAKCLAKDPRDRYQTAADLAVDLRTLRRESESGSRSGRVSLPALPKRRSGRRGPLIGAIVAAAAIAALAGWALTLRRTVPGPEAPVSSPPANLVSAPISRNRVVLTLFTNQSGNPDDDWLSQGLPEMLTTDLAQSVGLEVISTQRLYDLLASAGRSDVTTLDRRTATRLARWAGAGVVISGSIFRSGTSYRIDVQAHATDDGRVVAATRVEGDDIFQMADRLAADIRQGLQIAADEDHGIEAMMTSSPEAYRLFARGMKLYEELRFADAAGEFRKALAIDPAYATAQLRLGTSLLLAGEREDGSLWIGRAAGRANRMPDRERLLALGLSTQLDGADPAAAGEHLRELLRRQPGDVEAYFWIAQTASRGPGGPMESIKALRKAFDLDPNDPLTVAALVGQLEGLGLQDDAGGILDDFLRRNPAAAEGPIRKLHIQPLESR